MPRIYNPKDTPIYERLREAAAAQGKNIDSYVIVREDDGSMRAVNKERYGTLGGYAKTLASQAGASFIPSLAGTALAATGTALGGGLTPAGIGLGVGGAIVGGGATSMLQDKLLEAVAPSAATELELQRFINPRMSTLGNVLGGFSAGANAPRTLATLAKSRAAATGGSALREGAKAAAIPSGLAAGVEAGQELINEGEIDPVRVGLAGLAGPVQVAPTAAGRVAEGLGESLAGQISKLRVAGTPAVRTSPTDTYAEIMRMKDAGVTDPAAYKAVANQLNAPEASVASLWEVAERATEAIRNSAPEFKEKLARDIWAAKKADVPDKELPGSRLARMLIKEYNSGAYTDVEDFVRVARSGAPDITAASVRQESIPGNIAKANQQALDKSLGAALTEAEKVKQKADSAMLKDIEEYQENVLRASTAEEVQREVKSLTLERNLLKKRWKGLSTSSDQAAKNRVLEALAENKRQTDEALGRLSMGYEGKSAPDDIEALIGDAKEDVEALVEKEVKKLTAKVKRAEKAAPKEPGTVPPVIQEAPPVTPIAPSELATAAAVSNPPPPVQPKAAMAYTGKAIQTLDGRVVPFDGATLPEGVTHAQIANLGLVDAQGKFKPLIEARAEHEAVIKQVLAKAAAAEPAGNPPAMAPALAPEAPPGATKSPAKAKRAKIVNAPAATKPPAAAKPAAPEAAAVPVTQWIKPDETGAPVLQPGAPVATPDGAGKVVSKIAYTDKYKVEYPDGVVRGVDGRNLKVREEAPASAPKLSADDKSTIQSELDEAMGDLNSPEERHSGVPPALMKSTLKAVGALADRVVMRPLRFFTKPVVDHMRELGKSGAYLADKDMALARDATRTFNVAAQAYTQAYKGLSATSVKRVNQYLADMFDYGVSVIQPTPSEFAAIQDVRAGIQFLRNSQWIQGGPLVKEGSAYRLAEMDPNYIPSMIDGKVNKVLHDGNPASPEYQRLKNDYLAFYQERLNISRQEAEKLFLDFVTGSAQADPRNAAKFNAVRLAEGVGLPVSWRAPLKDALYWHAYRSAKDLAWFKHIQDDPIAAHILGELDSGKGYEHDVSDLTWEDGGAIDRLAQNSSVQAWAMDVNSHKFYTPQWLDRLTALKNSLTIGPRSALRDFLSTPGHMAELLAPGEYKHMLTALKEVMTPGGGARERIEKAGVQRAHRGLEFTIADDFTSVVSRLTEVARNVSGRNLIESKARQFAFEVGRLVGKQRLANGDYGLFDQLKIPDWRQLNAEALADAVGAKFVESAQGQYRASGLPAWLLASGNKKADPFLRSTFSLARWGVERFNNWDKNVWQPLLKGRPGPMIASVLGNIATAGLVRQAEEWLFNQKPPELTWAEWWRADNKETKYTLFSKLQVVGFAGVLSDLIFSGVQLANKEMPMGWKYPGWQLATQTLTRLLQAGDAVAHRGAGAFETLIDFTKQMLLDHVQIAKLANNWINPDEGNRRVERMYERATGEGEFEWGELVSNPFNPVKAMRDARSVEEIEAALPGLERAVEATGKTPVFQSQSRDLVPRSVPSFYEFLEQLQGPAAAEAQLGEDLEQDQLTLLKRMYARRAALTARAPR